jgi:hypothetical protein
MRHLFVLFIHLIAVLTQLFQPGGVRSLVAESLLLKHQLLVNRSRDRILAGWMALVIRPTRLLRSAIVLKPSTHEQAKVPHAVLSEPPSEARPERTQCRTHPFGGRNEAT